VPIFAGKQLGGPPAQIPSVLAGACQVGPDGFVLAGANYARQHGKRAVPAQIVCGLVTTSLIDILWSGESLVQIKSSSNIVASRCFRSQAADLGSILQELVVHNMD